MPSVLIGQPLASGSQPLVSGNPWSGTRIPIGGITMRWGGPANAYVTLSGGPPLSGPDLHIGSGGMFLSGTSGLMDGFPLSSGESLFVPKALLISGQFNIYIGCDAAASGIGRMWWEPDIVFRKQG
jgi:hypothetical protein